LGSREIVPNFREWLEAHGLGQYSTVFAAHDIDFDVLAELSDADLERLGLSLGHRRRLQRAVAARGDEARTPVAASRAASQSGAHEARAAERRQVTVMFCDLVGSTELANVLDPEDMGDLIHRFQRACAEAIVGFDGFVAKFMGDGVLAYFGYPEASEDAAEHAVRAALTIVEAIKRLERPDGHPLEARIGIATGTVMIGDMIGEGAAREHSIVGETPNLAARLQAMADPNAIVIGQVTRHLLGRRFEYEGLGDRALKGFAAPVRVWRVLREAGVDSRFAAMRETADGAFVGRSEELELLRKRWRFAMEGHGLALLVCGEAGIGKSRLVDALFGTIDRLGRRLLTCQCSPYHTNSALYPVIRHLERAAGFAVADTDQVKLDKLEAMLAETSEDRAAISLVADLLSLPTNGYAAPDLSPVQRRSATINALVGIIRRLAGHSPVLLLLEDAHWIDPTTRDLWTRLIDSIADAAVLTIVTARPEFVSPWPADRMPALELTRLTSEESAELVAAVAAPHVPGVALVDDIVAKADGVPLFVEELTKSVLEQIDRPTVPATLQDALMARLDRLGPTREIAQIAAVIGSQFSLALLADVMQAPAKELAASLEQLVDAGLAIRMNRATEPTYTFKHALLRDVAYENLLRTRRAQLHAKVAQAIVEHFPALAESEPELPAHHYAQAGQPDLACTWRERAADRAVSRSSFIEAVAQFDAALAEAAKLHAGPERTRRELALLLKAGPPLTIIKGGHSIDVAELYQRAHERAAALDEKADLFKATWGLWYNTVTTRRLDRARDHAQSLAALAEKANNDDLVLEGFHCRWSTALFRGEVTAALEHSHEGIERYDRDRHRWLGPVFGGHDPGVCAYGVHHLVLLLAGRHAEAAQCAEQNLVLAEELKHPNSIAHALINNLVGMQLRHEYDAVARNVERLVVLVEKYNLPPPRAHGMFLRGWLQSATGDFDNGMALMEEEYPRASAIGPYFRYYAALLADARVRAGRYSEALALLRSAIATITEPGVGIYVSELYRLEGVCLLHTAANDVDDAIHSLRTAVSVARQQGATLLELEAAASLARAAITLGRGDKPLGSLRALCDSLPPGFDAPALANARALLAV
jgi:class 3 adenylate cyclase/predicted ATPase